jgi:dodecin
MSDNVYKHIHITGSSRTSSDDAVRTAISKAGESVRELKWFKVKDVRGHIQDGEIAHWQVTLELGFTIEN